MSDVNSRKRKGGGVVIAVLIGLAIGVTQNNIVLGVAVAIALAVVFSMFEWMANSRKKQNHD